MDDLTRPTKPIDRRWVLVGMAVGTALGGAAGLLDPPAGPVLLWGCAGAVGGFMFVAVKFLPRTPGQHRWWWRLCWVAAAAGAAVGAVSGVAGGPPPEGTWIFGATAGLFAGYGVVEWMLRRLDARRAAEAAAFGDGGRRGRSAAWMPIALNDLAELIRRSEAEMTAQKRRFWDLVRVPPEKWALPPWGDEGGGFWVVGLIGGHVVWYNDIEHGFNVSRSSDRGVIGAYGCGQGDLRSVLFDLLRFVAAGEPVGGFGPPRPIDRAD